MEQIGHKSRTFSKLKTFPYSEIESHIFEIPWSFRFPGVLRKTKFIDYFNISRNIRDRHSNCIPSIEVDVRQKYFSPSFLLLLFFGYFGACITKNNRIYLPGFPLCFIRLVRYDYLGNPFGIRLAGKNLREVSAFRRSLNRLQRRVFNSIGTKSHRTSSYTNTWNTLF